MRFVELRNGHTPAISMFNESPRVIGMDPIIQRFVIFGLHVNVPGIDSIHRFLPHQADGFSIAVAQAILDGAVQGQPGPETKAPGIEHIREAAVGWVFDSR